MKTKIFLIAFFLGSVYSQAFSHDVSVAGEILVLEGYTSSSCGVAERIKKNDKKSYITTYLEVIEDEYGNEGPMYVKIIHSRLGDIKSTIREDGYCVVEIPLKSKSKLNKIGIFCEKNYQNGRITYVCSVK